MTMPKSAILMCIDTIDEQYDSTLAEAARQEFAAINAPTTLDEALRNYRMFGRFFEYLVSIKLQVTASKFGIFWCDGREDTHPYYPEYVAFVKEEMGK